jgi:two-component system, NarL family, nitrate/nitrite response regulator NarL
MSDSAVNLLLVDDHPLYHAGLASVLRSMRPHYCLLSACDGPSGLRTLQENPATDLVLIDIVLPGADGFEAVADYGRVFPHIPRVLISGRDDKATLIRASRSGASGFVSKAWPVDRLVSLIECVLAGETGFDDSNEHQAASAGRKEDLTLRQIEVLCLLSEGKSNKEIAHSLQIAERTVRAHLTELFHALDVGTRMNAVLKAQQLGIVP